MVFPERPLIQGGAARKGDGGPLGDAGVAGFPAGRQVLIGEIEVLEDLVHDESAVVPGLVQVRIVGIEDLVVPGDVAVGLDALEIEVAAEETGHGLIFGPHGGVLALVEVLEHEVDVPQAGEAPALGRGVPRARDIGGEAVVDLVVAVVGADVGPAEVVHVEIVRPQDEVGLVPEGLLRGRLVLGKEGQVAAEGKGCGNGQGKDEVSLFHNPDAFRR